MSPNAVPEGRPAVFIIVQSLLPGIALSTAILVD